MTTPDNAEVARLHAEIDAMIGHYRQRADKARDPSPAHKPHKKSNR